ncbi:MAG TPA: sensor histidine kinase, partial [Ferruginibacter sp.]|nr:sensor histidine kinase [Ferruginibacter sp.]
KEKEKQQLLNAALDRENDLKASQLKKEKNIKWLLAGGIGLLLLSGVAILALYRRQQRKSAIIEKQAADLEVLMKEIHHRVKNNLQIVSSLLDLQSHYITDQQASEAVKEGKNRVQSMALIHQNLYSEGNIKGIRVKEYISNLLQTLCSSYNISNDQVRITANIDNINLDVDTMIPIGLVLNELVTNAFKYAFREAGTGELEILLKASGDKLKLLVKDNGTGFPAGMDLKNSKSFGLKMIRAFAQKLKARLDIYNNEGAVVEMEISKFKTA